MARLPKVTKEKIATDTRRKLLDAASAEFASRGYVGANINRISQAAGFAKGTIYNYFPSKHALMLALVDEIAVLHVDAIQQQVELEQDPIRRLERFFRAGFAFVERYPAQSQLIVNTIYGPDAEFKARVYQAYKRLFELIMQDILQAGIALRQLRPVDPDEFAALVMSVYLGACSQIEPDGKIWLDPGQVATFILDGFRSRDRHPDNSK